METIYAHLTDLGEKVRTLETFYQSLPTKLFHQRLPSRITQLLRDRPNKRAHQYQPQSSFAFQILSYPTRYGLKEDSEHLLVLKLHVLADNAIDVLTVLQSFVLYKYTQERERQKKQNAQYNPLEISVETDGLRRDREEERESGKEGKGRESSEPWFQILLSKYRKEYGTHQHEQHDTDLLTSLLHEEETIRLHFSESSTSPSLPPKWCLQDSAIHPETERTTDMTLTETEISQELPLSPSLHPKPSNVKCRPPLGLFCTYLSCCVIGEVDCTEPEWTALMKVSCVHSPSSCSFSLYI
jgi:hypothetical protein